MAGSIAAALAAVEAQSTGQTDSADNETDNSLGKDAFLELLITQLKNQDPLKPMENKEFIAQMAQLRSLEQMQHLNENIGKFLQVKELTQGASLIGKTVEKSVEGEDQAIKGKVAKVVYEDDTLYAVLEEGATKVKIDNITAIY